MNKNEIVEEFERKLKAIYVALLSPHGSHYDRAEYLKKEKEELIQKTIETLSTFENSIREEEKAKTFDTMTSLSSRIVNLEKLDIKKLNSLCRVDGKAVKVIDIVDELPRGTLIKIVTVFAEALSPKESSNDSPTNKNK